MEHCLTSEVPDVLIEYARLRDLTIVPAPEGEHVDQWASATCPACCSWSNAPLLSPKSSRNSVREIACIVSTIP